MITDRIGGDTVPDGIASNNPASYQAHALPCPQVIRTQPNGFPERCMGVEPDAEIYLKHRDGLLRYATSLVGTSRAEDVVSTIILRTIRRRSLTDIEDPRSYLMKAVLNESRSVWRRYSPEPLPESLRGGVAIEVTEALDAVWRLPVQQRAAVFLFYWEDLSVSEVGEAMGLRPGTVKRYLHDARKRLKGQLE